jgi:hypothetical protein
LLRTGVPRFNLFGDFALLEHATRHAWTGDTLLGPYSRFGWNHPGPLFFYFAAPFEMLFGPKSTGLYVATAVMNALAAVSIVVSARLFGQRAHAAAALGVVLAWFAAFGSIVANTWNPLLVVLPLTAYLVAAAYFAWGKSAAVFPAVFFGALVSQHHIAAVTTVATTGALALGAFLWGRRRRGGIERGERRRLMMAAALLVVLFLPPILEQLTAPRGNLTKIIAFFLEKKEPKSFSTALTQWITATSWMPDRILKGALADEGYIPLVMRWDAMPAAFPKSARVIAVVQVLLLGLAALLAVRRRDYASLMLLGFGAFASAVAVSALRAIVGISYHYLVFWTTAASSVIWIGVLATFFSALPAIPRIAPVAILLGLGAAAVTTSLQRTWVAKNPVAPASRPREEAELHATYDALVARLTRDGAVAVIHAEGAWDMAYASVLELEKDKRDVRVRESDRWLYPGVASSVGLEKPLHVYFATTPLPLPIARCPGLEQVSKFGDVTMYVSPVDVTGCP